MRRRRLHIGTRPATYGLGAVATTFISGCYLAQKGIAKPFGSLTQMGTIRLG